MPDSRVPALTEVSTPDLADVFHCVDVSDLTDHATGTSGKLTLQRLMGSVLPSVLAGRLTTETGVPVSTSDRAAQGTLYFTPYEGNRVSLYDGTRWRLYALTERSLALTGLTADRNYDVFLYDNAGTLTLELSAAWTTDTARADALTTQDGVEVKSGATTRRWLGTIRASTAATTEDTEAQRWVANAYNRVPRRLAKTDATSHTYTSATIRQWNNTAGNQVSVVLPRRQTLPVGYRFAMTTSDSDDWALDAGVGVDSTTVFGGMGKWTIKIQSVNGTEVVNFVGSDLLELTAGYHAVAALEVSTAVETVTFSSYNLVGKADL